MGFLIRTKFEKNLYFINATFLGDVDFLGAVYDNDIKFNKANFSGNAHFNYIRSKGEANFESARFHHNANFSNAEFERTAYFNNAIFYREFNLTNAKIGKIYLRWQNIRDHLTCNNAIYLYLINDYKDQGLFDDADECYYNYMKIYKENLIQPWKFLNDLSWLTWGYGVKLHYTIIWSAITVFLFSLFFYRKDSLEKFSRKEILSETALDVKSGSENEGKLFTKNEQYIKATINFLDTLIFSSITFTSGSLALLWPDTEFRLNRNNKLASIERFLGWVFIPMILYMIVRIVVRV